MFAVKSEILLRSVIVNFDIPFPQKGGDNPNPGNYPTPIDLIVGDQILFCGGSYITSVTFANPAARITFLDAAGSGIIVSSGSFRPGSNNLYQFTGITVLAPNQVVTQSGFMQMQIQGAAATGGVIRFDFQIIRQH